MTLTESSRDRRPDFPFLVGTVELVEQELEAGCNGHGHVHLRNSGSEMIEFQTDQPILSTVLDPTTMEKVAGYTGWIAGTGLGVHLNAGDAGSIAVVFSTAHKNEDEMVALAPGEYLIKVDVPIYDLRSDGEGYERSYLTMPLAHLQLVEEHL